MNHTRKPSIALLLWAGCMLAGMSGFTPLVSGQTQAPEQPNVLFIFADDYSYDSVHATGNQEVQTPNIDSIARAGTVFSHAYNMGSWSGAVCVASRTMLNTGRFVWNAQQLDLNAEQQAHRTWAQMMNAAGYETYFTGKWHVKLKPQDLFDHVAHVRGGMPQQTPEGYNRPLPGQPDPWSPSDRSKGGFWEGGKHWSEVVADDAVAFLDDAAKRENPFFMYIAFNAPHDPRQAPQEFVDLYPAADIQIPVDFQSEYPEHEKIGCGKGLRDERLAPFPRTQHAVQVHRQEYYAIITHMDQQIGRILSKLEAAGMEDDTLVIFTADHGLACGHHGLLGKQNMHDPSIRVPLFLKGPGIPQGQTLPAPVYLQDTMATALDVAGAQETSHVAFHSLMPLLDGKTPSPYPAIYGGYLKLQRMVIEDDWKLIVYPEAQQRLRLYNLSEDPHEMQDLAGQEAQQERIKSLGSRLEELQRVTGDTLKLQWD